MSAVRSAAALPRPDRLAAGTDARFDLECAIGDAGGDGFLLDLALEDMFRQRSDTLMPGAKESGFTVLVLNKEQTDGVVHAVNRIRASVAAAHRAFHGAEDAA